jgi:FlaA1/EpsC-like NDP-sugar epimerase
MHEELLLDTGRDIATKHDKIYVEQPEDIDVRRLRANIKTLERMAVLMDEKSIIEKMREMISTYDPGGTGRQQNNDNDRG